MLSPTNLAFAMVVIGTTVALPSCGGASAAVSALSDGGGYDDAPSSAAMDGGSSFTLATVASPECVALATAQCERLATCSPEAFAAYDGGPRCIRDLAFECPLGRPHTLATSADVTTCANEYAALACSDVIEGNLPQSCDHVMHGTEDEDARCAIHADCSSGHCISRLYGCGLCENVPAAPGVQCGFNDNLCGHRLSCGVDLICWPPVGAGAPCGAFGQGDCAKDLYCLAGACVPRIEAGMSCDPDAIFGCKEGFFCNIVSRTCTAWQVVDHGPCGRDKVSGDWVVCRPGLVCRPTNGAMASADMRLCLPLREEGQSCGEDSFLPDIGEIPIDPTPCRRPAVCVGGTCVVAYVCP